MILRIKHQTSNLVQTLTCLPDLVIIGLPITSSSDSISLSLSLSSESLSYSSTWLKTAVDARVSCGTVASLTKLNPDTSQTTDRISEPGGTGRLFNLVSWKEDPCSGIRICIWIRCRRKSSCPGSCLIFSSLAPHGSLTHRTVVLQAIFHNLFLPCRKLIKRKWSHKPYILERHSSLWHWIV